MIDQVLAMVSTETCLIEEHILEYSRFPTSKETTRLFAELACQFARDQGYSVYAEDTIEPPGMRLLFVKAKNKDKP